MLCAFTVSKLFDRFIEFFTFSKKLQSPSVKRLDIAQHNTDPSKYFRNVNSRSVIKANHRIDMGK